MVTQVSNCRVLWPQAPGPHRAEKACAQSPGEAPREGGDVPRADGLEGGDKREGKWLSTPAQKATWSPVHPPSNQTDDRVTQRLLLGKEMYHQGETSTICTAPPRGLAPAPPHPHGVLSACWGSGIQ